MSALNENAITQMVRIDGVDAGAVAVTSLYTVPDNKWFVPDHVNITVTHFTDGGKGIQAVASFGGNAATYDDYISSATYTVAAAGEIIKSYTAADTTFSIQAPGDVFSISIETASDATLETWTVSVFGHLLVEAF